MHYDQFIFVLCKSFENEINMMLSLGLISVCVYFFREYKTVNEDTLTASRTLMPDGSKFHN